MKKKRTRVSDGVYRIAYWNAEKNKYIEPDKPFETYRQIRLDGREKRESKCFRSHSEAKEFHLSTTELVTKKKTIAEALKEYLGQYKGDITTKQKLESNFRHLDPVAHIAIEEFDEAELDKLISIWRDPAYLAKQKASRLTYKNELVALRQFLRYYASRSKTHYRVPILREHWKHIVVKQAQKKPDKRMSPEEWAKVQSAMKEICAGTPYEDVMPTFQMAQFLLFARLQEIAALEFEDIDAKAGTVTLNKRIQFLRKKVNGEREQLALGHKATGGKVIHSRMAVTLLVSYAMRNKIRRGPLFLVKGERLSYRSIQQKYDRAFRVAGLPLSGTHVIRHASLRQFQSTCHDLNLTKIVSGHASIRQVERYAEGSAQEAAHFQAEMEQKIQAALDTVG